MGARARCPSVSNAALSRRWATTLRKRKPWWIGRLASGAGFARTFVREARSPYFHGNLSPKLRNFGESTMKIKIDHAKCPQPDECGKCLNICPTGVFFLRPQGKFSWKPEFQKSITSISYKLEPRFKGLCNLCMACVDVCPTNAITIKK